MSTPMPILTSVSDGIYTILLNRPHKKNALTRDMYATIRDALKEAGSRSDVHFAVITGTGDYYSSGNDLGNLMEAAGGGDPDEMAKAGRESLEPFVGAFIDFPKPLIALVQGPAVGIMVTTLALCDVVYAADSASFHAPFSKLGQSPEACSSATFPAIMGPARANEFLFFGRKWTAAEAASVGLVSRVFPAAAFGAETSALLRSYASLPPEGLGEMKRLCRGWERRRLHDVNAAECELLCKRWVSPECANAIIDFFQGKAKL